MGAWPYVTEKLGRPRGPGKAGPAPHCGGRGFLAPGPRDARRDAGLCGPRALLLAASHNRIPEREPPPSCSVAAASRKAVFTGAFQSLFRDPRPLSGAQTPPPLR